MNPSELAVIELKLKHYSTRQLVDADIISDIDVRVEPDFYGNLAFQLRTHILTDDLPPERLVQRTSFDYEIPSSTWQMWKQRNAGAWWGRWIAYRWPVRSFTIRKPVACEFDLERFRGYPQAQVRVNDSRFGRAVRFHQITNLSWRTDEDPT